MTPISQSEYQDQFNQQFDDDNIMIKRYLSLFLSNWYWFAISLFLAVTIAYGINRYSEELFTVYSTLLIKDAQQGGGMSFAENFLPGSNVFSSQQNLKNEIGILKSFKLNKRVIDSLPDFRIVCFGVGRRNIVESRLYRVSPFKVITESINDQPLGVKINITIKSASTYLLEINGNRQVEKELNFGDRFNEKGFDFVISLRDPENFNFKPGSSNRFYFYFTGSENLANQFRGKLNVTPIDNEATLVTLSSSGFDPKQEADYLNKLMELYISQGLEEKNQIADSTLRFIDRQLERISDSLYLAEDNLQNFRIENKLIDIRAEGNQILSRLEKHEEEKARLILQRHYYQYLEEYLDSKNESGDIVSPSVMGVADQGLDRLVQELAILQQKKKQLSMNLTEGLPPVNLLEENIIYLKKTLTENVRGSLKTLDNSIEDMNNRLSQVFNEMSKLTETERMMINFQRKFDLNNTVYNYLLEKRAETGIAKASNVSDNKITDEAEAFNYVKIKPNKKNNLIKALLLGLVFPGIILFILYYLNNTIIDNGDIVRRTSVPVIGYVSHNENRKEIPVIDNPGSSLSESFRSVRTNLQYFIQDENNPVIVITSTISSEGKTFISINLAAIIASLGKKVLLIGLDLRKPRIHKILGIDNNEGMSDYLSHNCGYEDVIKETSIKNMFYATSGPVPPNPAELIEGERMSEFIAKARKEYDYIIVDTPPVGIVTDTLLLAKFSTVNIFVVRQRYSSKNTIELIQELHKDAKLKNMNIIINDISLTGYYGYGLRYGYYQGYGYSYGRNYYGKYSFYKYGYRDKEQGYYNS